ncbi:CAP domain-containing protein [Roseibacillus persicicus]|uniref:Transporter n=1 Tax=Roseibacillus persicicus TaxID=454148 RepID=A0A918WLV8_9BACT|nr:CAP domain-containing protein [Roseibacillus persicicus]GHC55152.1 transporter [Roseibacillus persicicus]
MKSPVFSFPFIGLLSLFLVSCSSQSPTSSPPASGSSPATSKSTAKLENETFYYVNGFRDSKGLIEFKSHPGLKKLAEEHSLAMLKRGEMEHFGFESRAAYANKKYQLPAMSENLHHYWSDNPSAEKIVRQWIESPPHRKNLVGSYNYAGVGIAREGNQTYSTLLMARGYSNMNSQRTGPYLEM